MRRGEVERSAGTNCRGSHVGGGAGLSLFLPFVGAGGLVVDATVLSGGRVCHLFLTLVWLKSSLQETNGYNVNPFF